MGTTYIQLKADDVLPWGKYKELTLRLVYKKDLAFYKRLCSQPDAYGISSATKRIIEKDLPTIETSPLSYSKKSKGASRRKRAVPPRISSGA